MAGPNAEASPPWNKPITSSQPPHERSMRLRQLKPKELGDNGISRVPKQKIHTKQPRSYTGCVSCKQRRIKCDETKPFCQQCTRRKVVCRGYVRRIKWIDAGTQQHASTTSSSDKPTELSGGSDIGVALRAVEYLEQEGTHELRKTPASAALVTAQDEDEGLDDEVTDPFIHYKPIVASSKRVPRRISHQVYPFGNAMVSAMQNPFSLYQQPQFSAASPENIAILYHRHASDILSIRDSAATNPWQTRIWPLAKENKALYHALAAMTCLYMGKAQPGLRVHGVMHAQESLESLVRDIQNESVCEEAAIASGLALGFGDTFDHKAGSTSFQHTISVKSLLERFINQQQQPAASQKDMDMVCFLAGNWMYMDIIARFTSDSDAGVPDYDLWNTCVFLQRSHDTYQHDPLMGCASGLFSDLGRVANLVRRVRSTDSTSNSVAVVSAAAHMRARIEQWIPTINLPSVPQHDSNVPDALQTAEAYRWAALLLLRQAVPELPWLMSLQDMAQKILVLLATISHSSRTVVVHILPLTIAGCEATSSEDRTWVRERWLTMSRRMLTAIVDKCLQVTEEVWKRRDFDKQDNGPHSTFTHAPDGEFGTKLTVKSKLHWIQVMKDWDWEVMLG